MSTAAKTSRRPEETSGWVGSAFRKKIAANEMAMVAMPKYQNTEVRVLKRLTLIHYNCRCLLTLACLLAIGCKSGPRDPEAEISEFVSKFESKVESKALGDVADLIDEEFTGKGRYNKQKIISLLKLQFLRRRSIHILSRISEVSFPTKDTASVILFAGMAGRPVDSLRSFTGIRADLMRFHFQLSYDGEWRLFKANWSRVRLGEVIRSLKAELHGGGDSP